MTSLAQGLYWKAPYFVKCWMASWYARCRDRERHGPNYDRVVREITERDQWSLDEFRQYQDRRLRELVRHAGRHVPYYREAFCKAGVDPEQFRGLEDLHTLPILEKSSVRPDPARLVDERLNRKRLLVGQTSGTTGTPIDLYRDVLLESAAYAYWDARCRSVAGLKRRRDVGVIIFGDLVTAPRRTRPPFWVHNRRWNELCMSSYHLAPQNLGFYVEAIRRFQPDFLEGYPSSCYAIGRHILENDLQPIPVKACFTTAETLLDQQRDVIEKAFGCRTYDQYGSGEMVTFAAECEHGTRHLSPDYGLLEVLDDDNQPVEPGQTGHLIGTSLLNFIQPFIRYRVGDVGAVSREPCPCGRALMPILERLEGRKDDVLLTRDGKWIGQLNRVFYGTQHIAEAQIVQDDYEAFRIRLVPGRNYNQAEGERLVSNLKQRLGEADIRIELVDEIERTAAGKFRAVICRLPEAKRPGRGR